MKIACSPFLFCRQSEGKDLENAFYSSAKWKRKRKSILRRDEYQCQECKKYGKRKAATIVHHIKELEDYPELAFDNNNLESVCLACHNAKHPEKGKKSLKVQNR